MDFPREPMDIKEAEEVIEKLFVEGFIEHCVLTTVSEICQDEMMFLSMANLNILSDLYMGPTTEDDEYL